MNPKVAAGGAAGAVTVILVFVLSEVGVELPPEVASAVTALLSVAAGWFKVE
jgi:hypothetical protein